MVVYYTDQQSMQKVEVPCLAHRAFCKSFTHQTEQVKKGPPTNQSTELQGPRPCLATNAQDQVSNILNRNMVGNAMPLMDPQGKALQPQTDDHLQAEENNKIKFLLSCLEPS